MINLSSAFTPPHPPPPPPLGCGVASRLVMTTVTDTPQCPLIIKWKPSRHRSQFGRLETASEENMFYFLSVFLPSIQSHWRGLSKWGSFDVCQLGYTETGPGKGSGWPQRVHVSGEGASQPLPLPCSSRGGSFQAGSAEHWSSHAQHRYASCLGFPFSRNSQSKGDPQGTGFSQQILRPAGKKKSPKLQEFRDHLVQSFILDIRRMVL